MQLKTLKEWFTNFGTVFSILGFFVTIYLGIWYVPSWLKESQNEKIRNAENEILKSVKEIIYNDSTLSVDELTSLIHAKELTLKEKFPLSLSDVLTKTEESFMEDKFLPLFKRRDLIKKIESIKQKLPKETFKQGDVQKSESKGAWWSSLLSILLTILSVILGLISFFIKYKIDKEKEEEIKNEMELVTLDLNNTIREYSYQFENSIHDILKARTDVSDIYTPSDRGVDFIVHSKNKKYFIEAKYLSRSKIGLNTFNQLASYIKDKTGEGWLIYNTALTSLVESEIEKFNKENKHIKIKAIRATDAKQFADKLDELLPKT